MEPYIGSAFPSVIAGSVIAFRFRGGRFGPCAQVTMRVMASAS